MGDARRELSNRGELCCMHELAGQIGFVLLGCDLSSNDLARSQEDHHTYTEEEEYRDREDQILSGEPRGLPAV